MHILYIYLLYTHIYVQHKIFYAGSTNTTINIRNSNYKARFNSKFKNHNTELSNYILEFKGANKDYSLKWEIPCKTIKKKLKLT